MFSTVKGVMPYREAIVTGVITGILAPVPTRLGNPGHRPIPTISFPRDTAGTSGWHVANGPQPGGSTRPVLLT